SLTFFLLTLQPPPRSTLFPYTTLFRSLPRSNGAGRKSETTPHYPLPRCLARLSRSPRKTLAPHRTRWHSPLLHEHPRGRQARPRSEEHTSELQSLAYLVCRLLLEKKKK